MNTTALRKQILKERKETIDDIAALERMKARQQAVASASWYLIDQHLFSELPAHLDIQGHLLRLKFDRFVPTQDKDWLEFMMCN